MFRRLCVDGHRYIYMYALRHSAAINYFITNYTKTLHLGPSVTICSRKQDLAAGLIFLLTQHLLRSNTESSNINSMRARGKN